ncbi:MAG: alpha-L-rhamnosidase N-terminal domain-containing protein, partial [Mucilaginibacter polytrichastri]|nr:alpha-L-rhamnosidase N-terminal domain-containing protein [Mucilaginibacter polytrichastri]
MFRKLAALFTAVFFAGVLHAQNTEINPELLRNTWKAQWITSAAASQRGYGVYHFRRNFQLSVKQQVRFIVHVSADNRYRLFVNGKAIGLGPARGDLYNWYFDTYDIGPYLRSGKNTIAALVWNMGSYAPVAQISNQTGFILQGDGKAEEIVNTGKSWKVIKSDAYQPCSTDNGARLHTYMVIGPGDFVDAKRYAWNWQTTDFNDEKWPAATQITAGVPAGYGTDNLWTLAPRSIPPMEEIVQPLNKIRRSTGLKAAATLFASGPLRIPARSSVSILLDAETLTKAYPELTISKGRNASIKITYAEALTDKSGKKGNRDSVGGKSIAGNFDVFVSDGGENRMFRPLWMRTYRYVQLDIKTEREPLLLTKFQGIYSGYPFELKARFSSNDASLKKIWDVGWHTARMCAGETYFDCPYYEQLQYEADTRIQALISLYVSGDDRLMRKALLDFYHSRVPEGLTQGRYPSNRLQVIPTFSLFWVSMMHDYLMLRRDDAFLKQFLPAVREVMVWYENRIDAKKNMLGPMTWWSFTDWADAFANGVPPGATNGNSSVITLQYVYTLRQAADLFAYFKDEKSAKQYRKTADMLMEGTARNCYNKTSTKMGDTPEKQSYSQHAGIMAVLTGAVPTRDQQRFMQ